MNRKLNSKEEFDSNVDSVYTDLRTSTFKVLQDGMVQQEEILKNKKKLEELEKIIVQLQEDLGKEQSTNINIKDNYEHVLHALDSLLSQQEVQSIEFQGFQDTINHLLERIENEKHDINNIERNAEECRLSLQQLLDSFQNMFSIYKENIQKIKNLEEKCMCLSRETDQLKEKEMEQKTIYTNVHTQYECTHMKLKSLQSALKKIQEEEEEKKQKIQKIQLLLVENNDVFNTKSHVTSTLKGEHNQLIQRKTNMDIKHQETMTNLKNETKYWENERNTIKTKLNVKKDKQCTLENEMNDLQTKEKEIRISLESYKQKIDHLQNCIQLCHDHMEALADVMNTMHEGQKQLDDLIHIKETEIESQNKDKLDIECVINRYIGIEEEKEKEKKELDTLYSQLEDEVKGMEKERQTCITEQEKVKKDIESEKTKMNSLDTEIQKHKETQTEYNSSNHNLENTIHEMERQSLQISIKEKEQEKANNMKQAIQLKDQQLQNKKQEYETKLKSMEKETQKNLKIKEKECQQLSKSRVSPLETEIEIIKQKLNDLKSNKKDVLPLTTDSRGNIPLQKIEISNISNSKIPQLVPLVVTNPSDPLTVSSSGSKTKRKRTYASVKRRF
ncbi:hypothetical protein WA158_000061 [Blastocystis sp. Blastoise]